MMKNAIHGGLVLFFLRTVSLGLTIKEFTLSPVE